MSTAIAPSNVGGKTYKGKVTGRSWPQLPEEVIRIIATFYLHSLQSTSYTPRTWSSREYWQHRMLYTVMRDAVDLERNVMGVCLGWHRALQHHMFWQQAINLIDPNDTFLAHLYPPKPMAIASNRGSTMQTMPTRLTWWRHFRNIVNLSCIICRISSPPTNIGLGNVHPGKDRRTTAWTPYLGYINVCRDHERRKNAFCGLCLREAPSHGSTTATAMLTQFNLNAQAHAHLIANLVDNVACLENDDLETWPNVEATCKSCRAEWLWKKCENDRDREAIGGPHALRPKERSGEALLALLLNGAEDWETRNTVEGFLEMAEGGISDLLALAREKLWLRKNTKLGDMMQQALAARRWNLNPGQDLSSRASPVHDSDPVAVTISRTISSSGASDVVSEEDVGQREAPSDTTVLEPERRPILRDVSDLPDEFESILDEEESVASEIASDDEDAQLLQSEENNVKDIALQDWARARILDGYWISPADSWYGYSSGYPPPLPRYQDTSPSEDLGSTLEERKGEGWTFAVNPCPWTVEKDGEGSSIGSPKVHTGPSANDGDAEMEEESHPRWSTVVSDVPPTFGLCEQAYLVHQRMLRTILFPAMKNIVRKIVMENGAAAEYPYPDRKVTRSSRKRKRGKTNDPAIIVSRMQLEDVVRLMREEEGVWFDGVDWVERMHNADADEEERDNAKRKRDRRRTNTAGKASNHTASGNEHHIGSPPTKKRRTSAPSSPIADGNDNDMHIYESEIFDSRSGHDTNNATTAASASSRSGSGGGTSPVLSTTTLGTTPSPPMYLSRLTEDRSPKDVPTIAEEEEEEEEFEEEEDCETKIMIPVSPCLDPPKLLRPIPYVPMTIARFPQYTLESLKMVWREACAPLYQCHCRICERASLLQAAATLAHNGGDNHRSDTSVDDRPPPQIPSREPRQKEQQRENLPVSPTQPRQQIEHEGELLELEEVVIPEVDFDSDEVVEFDFENDQPERDREREQEQEETGRRPYQQQHHAQEREQECRYEYRHQNPPPPPLPARQKVPPRDSQQAQFEKSRRDLLKGLNEEDLRAFGFWRDARGNFIDLSGGGDDVPTEGVDSETVSVAQSPIPSEDVGDTTSYSESLDSAGSRPGSRKRSCDELDVERGREGDTAGGGLEAIDEQVVSSKRARLTPQPQVPPLTPKRRRESRLPPHPRTPVTSRTARGRRVSDDDIDAGEDALRAPDFSVVHDDGDDGDGGHGDVDGGQQEVVDVSAVSRKRSSEEAGEVQGNVDGEEGSPKAKKARLSPPRATTTTTTTISGTASTETDITSA